LSDVVLMTGMSGAGRSTAAAALEDAGWYVIDNMPPSLLSEVAGLVASPASPNHRVALVLGRGGGADASAALPAADSLEAAGHRVRMVYLDAPDEVLVRRYEGTRRRHPVAAGNVEDAIREERRLLAPLRDRADLVLDTGELNVNQLRSRVMELFSESASAGNASGMQTSVVSFGFKNGLPLDADLVFDCRFLPNPHWVEDLRPRSGLDAQVRDFVLSQPSTRSFLDRLTDLLELLLPGFVAEGKSYLTIAMGCTGGRHRSVVLAEELARILAGVGARPTVFHRDVDR
jgi:UPF0042 nucleotide-binding protein